MRALALAVAVTAVLAIAQAGSSNSSHPIGWYCTGPSTTIFNNWNGGLVSQGSPTNPTFSTGADAFCVDELFDWHYVGDPGPGTMGLAAQTGALAGSGFTWPATIKPGGYGPNEEWHAYPVDASTPEIIQGSYACEDSGTSSWSYDDASNDGFCQVLGRQATADTSPPTVSLAAPADGTHAHGTLTFEAGATDVGAGVDHVDYLVSPHGSNAFSTVATGTAGPGYSATWNSGSVSDGSYDVEAIAYDKAGLSSTPTAIATIVLDNTPPSLTVLCNGVPCQSSYYTASPVSVTVTASDANGVGPLIYSTTYANVFLDPQPTSYAGAIAVTGSTTFSFGVTDGFGNIGSVSVPILIDTTPPPTPSLTMSPASFAHLQRTGAGSYEVWFRPDSASHSVVLGVPPGDDPESNVTSAAFTTIAAQPGFGIAPATPTSATVSWGPLLSVGPTYAVSSTNGAGMTSAASTAVGFVADSNPPSGGASCNPEGCGASGPVIVTPSLSDAQSGIALITYTTDGTDPSATNGTPIANGTPIRLLHDANVKFWAIDNVGNETAPGSIIVPVTAAPAPATFTVNATGDSHDAAPGDDLCADATGLCTLRAAVEEADALPSGSAISVPAGTYSLSLGQLSLSQSMSIDGASARTTEIVRPSTATAFRLVEISNNAHVAIGGLNMHGGNANVGGGIAVDPGSTLDLGDSALWGNTASDAGGGIDNQGTLNIARSSINGNTVTPGSGSGIGGGIRDAGTSLHIANSTIAGNEALVNGGGVFTVSLDAAFQNDTIANNQSGVGGGGGIFAFSNVAPTFRNTLVSGNIGGACAGSMASLGYNLVDDTTCGFETTGDMQGGGANLGPFADNGGPTDTFLPGAGSQAIDNGDPATCSGTDQRGTSRPQGAACDIGSVEVVPAAVPTTWNLAQDLLENATGTHANPFGPWEIEASSGLTHDPSTYHDIPASSFSASHCGAPNLAGWVDTSTAATATINTGTTTINGLSCASGEVIPPGVATLHPGSSQYAIYAWHSPVTGTVSIAGGMRDLDCGGGNGIAWSVDLGSSSIASGSFSNCGSASFPATLTANVTTGSTLYFVVDPNGDYTYDLTGVDATITQTSTAPPVVDGHIDASVSQGWLNLRNWLPGEPVGVTRNGTLLTTATTDTFGNAHVQLPDGTLHAGDTLVASDALESSTLVLANLSFDSLTLGGNSATGSGHAPAGAALTFNLFDTNGSTLQTGTTVGDGDGLWTLTVPGAYFRPINGQVGTQYAATGNFTYAHIYLPGPTVVADATGGNVQLHNWTPNESVQVNVGAYAATVTVDPSGNLTIPHAQTSTDLVSGTHIVVSDANVTRDFVLAAMTIDTIDVTNDLVSGTAPVGATVFVTLGDPTTHSQLGQLTVTSNSDGHWTANFHGIVDLTAPINASAFINLDANNDGMVVGRGVNAPTVSGSLTNDWVNLDNWPANDGVTLTVDGHVVHVTTDGNGFISVQRSTHGVDLVPGTTIAATDGTTTKNLTLANVGISSVSESTVSGFAPAGAPVQVCGNLGPTFLGCVQPTVSPAGTWSAAFDSLQPGAHLQASVADADLDRTIGEFDLAPLAQIDSTTPVYGGDGTSFAFSSSTPGAQFQCQVDTGPFLPCTSPFTAYVASGDHTFAVKASSDGRSYGASAQQSFTESVPSPTGAVARIDVQPNQLGPLDTSLGESVANAEIFQATCAKLMNFPDQPAPDGAIVQPEVAAGAPKVSSDGLTWSVAVRSGFSFADGTAVTAQSYKDALDRLSATAIHTANGDGATTFADIASTSVSGNTLTIVLNAPNYDLPELLASSFACPIPAGTPSTPVPFEPGSGPYTIVSATSDRIVLGLNPHYGGTRPHAFTEFDLDLGVAPAAGEARVLAGESDNMIGAPPDALSLAGSGSPNLLTSTDFGFQMLSLNTAKAPFDNVNMRKAVNFAVDRSALSRLSLTGLGGPATAQILSPGQPGYQPLDIYPLSGPDLAQARSYAALAGVDATHPVSVELFTNAGNASRDAMAHEIQTELAQIYVTVNIHEIPGNQLFGPTVPGGPDDMRLFAFIFGGADPDPIFQAVVGPNNFSNFADPTFAAQLAAAEALQAPGRYDAFATLERTLMRDYAPVVPLNATTSHDLFSTRIAPGSRIFNPASFGIDLAALNTALVVTNTNDSGAGSLRQAILDANASPGADTIGFAIAGTGVRTIQLQSPLPDVSGPVTIDGRTQPGWSNAPLIQLDGSQTTGEGLRIAADDSTVRALAVDDFSGIGIHVLANRATLIGDYVGVDPTGAVAAGNLGDGVRVEGGGGSTIGPGNVVGGNGGHGIFLDGTMNTTVTGNVSGTNAAATAAIPNGIDGIAVDGGGSNTIVNNVSSGNTNQGISLFGIFFPNTSNNVVRGNRVGVDATGNTEIPNGGDGIRIYNGIGNTIGGTGALEGNLVQGNGGNGVSVRAASSGNLIRSNQISDNGAMGIALLDGSNHGVPAPAITLADASHVAGSFTAAASATYTFEVFTNAACDDSGAGEGQTPIGLVTAATDATGNATWTLSTTAVTAGSYVTATATANAAGDTSAFSSCFQTTPDVLNLTLTSDQATSSVGVSSLSIANLPAGLFPELAGSPSVAPIGEAAIAMHAVGAPIGEAPIGEAPIGEAPIGEAPIGEAPIGEAPIGEAGLSGLPIGEAPIGEAGSVNSPLDSILLTSLPGVDVSALIAGTSLDGRLPQQLTLGDVLRDPVTLARFNALPVKQVDFGNTALRGVEALSYLLGGKPLAEIPAPGGDWCAALTNAGGSCAGVDLLHTTIMGLDITRQLGTLYLGHLTVGQLTHGLEGTLLGSADIGRIAVTRTVLARIAVSQLPAGIVSCTTCATLGDAANANAINDGKTLLDLGTLADNATLDELVAAMRPRNAYPWEAQSFVGWQAFNASAPRVQYHLDFDVRCPAASVSARVTLPFGFAYLPGSTAYTVGAQAPAAGPDPTFDGKGGATWSAIPTTPCGQGVLQHVRVDFKGLPGTRLGPAKTSASISVDGAGASATGAPVDVQPASTAQLTRSTEPTLQPDTIYLSHIAKANDVNYFAFPEQGRGKLVTIYMRPPKGVDYDLYVIRPAPSSLISSPIGEAPIGEAPIGEAPIGEAGLSITTTTDNPPPELLDDGPLPSGEVAVDSIKRGDGVEVVQFRQAGSTGNDEIAIAGYNGAFSAQPFELRVKVDDPPPLPAQCLPRSIQPQQTTLPLPFNSSPAALALVNVGRMNAKYGVDATNAMLDKLRLVMGRPEVNGAVVPIDADPAVFAAAHQWDLTPCSIDAANNYVKAITAVIARYRTSALQSVTIVGDDEMIPFGRVPDFVTTTSEFDNTGSLAFTTRNGDNATYAAAALGYVQTDDVYGAFHTRNLFGHEFFLPEVAVGRLVETPSDIGTQLDEYLGTTDGVLHPQTGLVTGYDFMSDGATAVDSGLSRRIGATASATNTLLRDTWGSAAITPFLTGAQQAPDINSWNAHYDFHRMAPAVETGASDLVTTDLLSAVVPTRFQGRIFFTMGCHAGESIDDSLGLPGTTLDWAQSYARDGAAVFVGNTGYGYGDTASVALSEKLMALFAGHLGFDGAVGEKFMQAKNEYFASMGVYGAYDEKALEEATFYGLPFWQVNSPTEPLPTPPALGTDSQTPGLPVASLVIQPALTQEADARGTFWNGDSGVVFVPGRSVQPLDSLDVTQPAAAGLVAHGFFPTGLVSQDRHDINLYFAKPMIDQSTHELEPSVTNDTFPASPVKMAQADYLGRRHSTLDVIAGQSRPGSSPSLQTERLYTQLSGEVTYAPASVTDYTAPRFVQAGAVVSGGQATLFATVDDPTVLRVKAFFTTGGPWTFVDLQKVGPTAWKFTTPTSATKIEAGFVAEDAAANTGWMTAKGELLESVTPTDTTPSITIDRPLDGTSYVVGQSVTPSFACSSTAGIQSCASSPGTVDTSTFGTKSFSVSATTLAGTQKTKTASYSVVYDFGGFTTTKTKATPGSTIPVTFTLHGNFGTKIFASGYPRSGSIPCTGGTVVAGDPASTAGSSGVQYIASTNSYQWNWKTDKSYTGCRQLVIVTADGVAHRENFDFSK